MEFSNKKKEMMSVRLMGTFNAANAVISHVYTSHVRGKEAASQVADLQFGRKLVLLKKMLQHRLITRAAFETGLQVLFSRYSRPD